MAANNTSGGISIDNGSVDDAHQEKHANITSFISGVSLPEHLYDATKSLQLARQDGFDYVVTALPNTVPLLTSSSSNNSIGGGGVAKRSSNVVVQQQHRTDVTRLESKWWSTSIVGMIVDPPNYKKNNGSNNNMNMGNALLEALTSTSTTLAARSEKQEANEIFWGMMEWASHMNIPAVILPSVPLTTTDIVENSKHDDDINERKSTMSKSKNKLDIQSDDEEDIFAKESGNDDVMKMHQSKRGRTTHSPATILPTPSPYTSRNSNSNNDHTNKISINNPSAKEYARFISNLATSSICTTSRVQLWLRVPLTISDLQAYQLLLSRCDNSSSVGCMIYINSRLDTTDLPGIVRSLHAFIGGGHVKAVSWDANVFLTNKKGYPTLSKSHQYIFQLLYGRLGRTLRTLVEGTNGMTTIPRHANASGASGSSSGSSSLRLHHLQYLRHLRSKPTVTSKLDSQESILETPYLDSLQSPLQPLGDHLEYQTYETFEKDPIKYKQYGDAIAYALQDGIDDDKYVHLGSTRTTMAQLKRLSDTLLDMDDEGSSYIHNNNGGSTMNDDRDIVEVDIYQVTILVVGAGRGPLVRESIRAVSRVSSSLIKMKEGRGDAKDDQPPSSTTRRRKALYAKIVAIEKNPSAVLYLRSLKGSDPSWNGGQDYDPSSDGGIGGGRNDNNVVSDSMMVQDGAIVIPGTSNVSVIGCDMREANTHPILKHMIQNGKSRADIVVSELLGSFGDNELSPECLDGVQSCGILKEDCVSIPQSYTAFIAPVSSARLHSEAKTQSCLPLNTNEGPASPVVGMQRALETPYVVRSHAASQTSNEQACWTFSHPHGSKTMNMDTSDKDNGEDTRNPSAQAAKNINNDRHAHLSFQHDPMNGAGNGCGYGALDSDVISMASGGISIDNVANVSIHGLLGSFHSVLYESKNRERKSVISIAPSSFSVGMFSWFPLYFPLKEPLRVPPGATVNCSIWRLSDEDRVWYEWCAEVVEERETGEDCIWATSPVHNPGGRSYHVKK